MPYPWLSLKNEKQGLIGTESFGWRHVPQGWIEMGRKEKSRQSAIAEKKACHNLASATACTCVDEFARLSPNADANSPKS
jgi:hypothetical protein